MQERLEWHEVVALIILLTVFSGMVIWHFGFRQFP